MALVTLAVNIARGVVRDAGRLSRLCIDVVFLMLRTLVAFEVIVGLGVVTVETYSIPSLDGVLGETMLSVMTLILTVVDDPSFVS